MSLMKNKGSSFCTICRSTFFELFFFRISHPTFMSFCTQGLPGVAESTVSISEGKFSPSGKDTRQTDEGWEKVIFSGPHPPSSATVPPLPESEDYLLGGWILRLRLRLRAEWQGGRQTAKVESLKIKEANQNEICCYEHWFWIDVMCICIGLMLSAPVLDWF